MQIGVRWGPIGSDVVRLGPMGSDWVISHTLHNMVDIVVSHVTVARLVKVLVGHLLTGNSPQGFGLGLDVSVSRRSRDVPTSPLGLVSRKIVNVSV